jgi:hypothetical protein
MNDFRDWLVRKAKEYEDATIKAERNGLTALANSFIARRYEILYVLGAYDGSKHE